MRYTDLLRRLRPIATKFVMNIILSEKVAKIFLCPLILGGTLMKTTMQRFLVELYNVSSLKYCECWFGDAGVNRPEALFTVHACLNVQFVLYVQLFVLDNIIFTVFFFLTLTSL